jgi:hypothetical protein
MQAALPRELRDMVYSHVIDKLGPRFVRILQDESTRNWYIPNEVRFSDEYNESSVDSKTLNELAQMWYQRRLFYFDGTATVEPFLRADFWGSGINPKDHIRTIGIWIWASDMVFDLITREAFKRRLHCLLSLAPGTSLCLEIGIPLALIAYHRHNLMEPLEYVFDILKTLENRGLNVLVFPMSDSDTVPVSKAIKLLRGPVPSVAEWLHKVQIISGALPGDPVDVTDVDMSKDERMWYDLLISS